MKIIVIRHLISDYVYAIRKQVDSIIFPKPPAHYLNRSVNGKNPIILIPGVFEKWNFLKAIADRLSSDGHPIYILNSLEYNTKEISNSAKLVYEFIKENNLKNAIIIAHSKGGLIGKYVLAFYNKEEKIMKMIAIATPFGGSKIVKFVPYKVLNLSSNSDDVKLLQERNDVNNKIVSIFGLFDNHVWPLESCRLEGAKNIQVNAYGHHKILSDEKVIKVILNEVKI